MSSVVSVHKSKPPLAIPPGTCQSRPKAYSAEAFPTLLVSEHAWAHPWMWVEGSIFMSGDMVTYTHSLFSVLQVRRHRASFHWDDWGHLVVKKRCCEGQPRTKEFWRNFLLLPSVSTGKEVRGHHPNGTVIAKKIMVLSILYRIQKVKKKLWLWIYF